jgi:hypothetical protein
VFIRSLEIHMSMKGWFSRVGPVRDILSDARALKNRRHFGSNPSTDKKIKTPFFAN